MILLFVALGGILVTLFYLGAKTYTKGVRQSAFAEAADLLASKVDRTTQLTKLDRDLLAVAEELLEK